MFGPNPFLYSAASLQELLLWANKLSSLEKDYIILLMSQLLLVGEIWSLSRSNLLSSCLSHAHRRRRRRLASSHFKLYYYYDYCYYFSSSFFVSRSPIVVVGSLFSGSKIFLQTIGTNTKSIRRLP